MSSSNNEVGKFYDEFTSNQQKIAFNERHYFMYEKLLELGMNKNSSLLEIGCGIGVITTLISKTINSGKIFSTDISAKSIELNKENNGSNSCIEFKTGDITELDLGNQKFDFITLFDVLEHIPKEKHDDLFKKIERLMHEDSILFINIPSPEILEWFHKNKKEVLQIIDQPLPANELMTNAYNAGLILTYFKTYNIWHEKDYQIMFFKKKYNWKKIEVPQNGSMKKRVKNLLKG